MKYIFILIVLLPVWLAGAMLTYNIDNSDVLYSQVSGQFDRVATSNWVFTTAPGSYKLPVKSINIILPFGVDNVSPSWSVANLQTTIAAKPELNTAFSDGEHILTSNPPLQPADHVVFQGVGKWGAVSYARFAVYPSLYNSSQGMYELAGNINLEVSFVQPQNSLTGNLKVPVLLREDNTFINKAALADWYTDTNYRDYDYLVVTTPALYNAAQALVGFRQSQGLVTSFADINQILVSSPGSTPADKLRNYLVTQYLADSFTYLLLIGDIDVVPIAYLTPEPDGLETVPSDFYYSDLSSDFDSDHDGRLGEYGSGMDYTPEVYVGRIPWNDPGVVSSISTRTINFDTGNQPWKHKALLPAAILNYAAEDEAGQFERTDGATFMEYCKSNVLRSYQNTTMYEQAGIMPSLPSDYPLKADTLQMLLNNESWGIVNWSAHGSATSAARKVWLTDDDNDNLPDPQELLWGNLVSVDTFNNLANQDGSVYFSASCLNGTIDGDGPSLGEWLLKQKAVVDIAATRTGWYKLGWANPGWGGISSYNYHFLENYAQNGMTVGQAHAFTNWMHTQYCLFGDPIDTGGIIWPELQNIYTYLLFGDPAIGYPSQTSEPAGTILVWEPVGNTGNTIVNGLHDLADFNVVYTDHLIDTYNYLNQFDAVFCLYGLGYQPNNYYLLPTSFEYGYLLNYLQQGGKVYMEGMVNWDMADSLFSRFGTSAPFDHLAMIEQLSYSQGVSNQIWDYDGYNGGTQALIASGETAQPLFYSYNQNFVNDVIGVWNRVGNSRSISSSFNLAGVHSDTYPFSQFLSIILDTLDVFHNTPVPNQDEHQMLPSLVLNTFPNPFSDRLHILAKSKEPVSLGIYNIKGQQVKTVKLIPDKGEINWQWDGRDNNLHHLSAGIYLVKITDKQTSVTGKILKLR